MVTIEFYQVDIIACIYNAIGNIKAELDPYQSP